MNHVRQYAGLCGVMATLIIGCAGAFAAPSSTYRNYDSLSDQVAILQQKLKVAKLKSQIANAGSPGGKPSTRIVGVVPPGGGFPAHLLQSEAPRPTGGRGGGLPEIVSIEGRGKSLIADLLMPAGGQIMVKPGTTLGDLVVEQVTPDGVTVNAHGKRTSLPFAASENTPNNGGPMGNVLFHGGTQGQ